MTRAFVRADGALCAAAASAASVRATARRAVFKRKPAIGGYLCRIQARPRLAKKLGNHCVARVVEDYAAPAAGCECPLCLYSHAL